MKTPQTKPADLNDLFRVTDARARGRRVIRPLSRANKRNKSSNHTITMSTPSPKAAKSSSRHSIGMLCPGEARYVSGQAWDQSRIDAANAAVQTWVSDYRGMKSLMPSKPLTHY